MYIPSHYREDDSDTLIAFMRAHSFATLVTVDGGTPLATHLPVVTAQHGEALILSGHLAKANPQWKTLEGQRSALVIFTGPHGYVSPTLYEKRNNVPTWNYVAVHAYGAPRLIVEPTAVVRLMEILIQRYEPPYRSQWDELSESYRNGMLSAIVAFEIPVTRLEGKYKLSQNRTPGEQQHIIAALESLDDPDSLEMAGLMRRNLAKAG